MAVVASVFQPSISATDQSLDGLDTLTDSGDELVAPRVAPQVINLTIDSSDDVNWLHKLFTQHANAPPVAG